MKTAFLFALASLVSIPAFAGDCASEANYPIINKKELTEIVKDKSAFIVDVNAKSDFKKTHIPGAVNLEASGGSIAKMLPANKDALIVAYCGGPQCGAWKKAAEEACNMGYTNVKHFKDGIKGWNKKSS